MSVFDILPNELIIYTMNIILTDNIRAVAALAINRRIHALVDALWPQVARSRLIFTPSTMNISNTHKIFDTDVITSSTREIMFTPHDGDSYHDAILRIEASYNSMYPHKVTIITHNYVLVFDKFGTSYVIVRCLHRKVLPTVVKYNQDINTKSPGSISPRMNAKYLLTKILPELADLFIF